MTIIKLKEHLGLTNKQIAEFFGISVKSFNNSSAKKRYETAFIKIYEYLKTKN